MWHGRLSCAHEDAIDAISRRVGTASRPRAFARRISNLVAGGSPRKRLVERRTARRTGTRRRRRAISKHISGRRHSRSPRLVVYAVLMLLVPRPCRPLGVTRGRLLMLNRLLLRKRGRRRGTASLARFPRTARIDQHERPRTFERAGRELVKLLVVALSDEK